MCSTLFAKSPRHGMKPSLSMVIRVSMLYLPEGRAANGEKNAIEVSVNLPMLAGKSVQLLFDNANNKTQSKKVTVPENGKMTLSLKGQGGVVLIAR